MLEMKKDNLENYLHCSINVCDLQESLSDLEDTTKGYTMMDECLSVCISQKNAARHKLILTINGLDHNQKLYENKWVVQFIQTFVQRYPWLFYYLRPDDNQQYRADFVQCLSVGKACEEFTELIEIICARIRWYCNHVYGEDNSQSKQIADETIENIRADIAAINQ